MSIFDTFKHAAIDEATRLKSQAAQAEEELQALKVRQARLEAQIDSARLADERSRNFKAGLGPDFPCPRCFVVNETRSLMRAAPSGVAREDIFRCPACDFEVTVQA